MAFATSPSLLSAALAAANLPPAPPAPPVFLSAAAIAPLDWSLDPAQAEPQPGQPAETPPAGPDAQEEVGEIVVEGSYGPPASDPAERINEASYQASQVVDEVLVEPLANAYRVGLPEPIRDGLGNVVRNLGEPTNALNFLLQGKVGKAFGALGRMAINSTVGIGGLIDVAAKPGVGLPYRRNGFANTLGYYGVGPGPYLFLPITGPTTVRDQIGVTLDQALLPFVFGKPFNRPAYAISYFAINGLDSRLRDDAELKEIKSSDDPYGERRETYLARREREIAALKGEVVEEPAVEDADAPSDEAVPAAPAAQTDDAPIQPSGGAEAVVITQPR
ncbi:MAG: VacJ family lipoprotein [Erythrobacter sp.]|nr:VacJ family lipoprotein [Erythrobacter sp.]